MWQILQKYGFDALFGAITGGLGGAVKCMWHRQKCQIGKQEALEKGVRGMLHNELYRMCIFCDHKGYADVQDRDNLEALYKPYHALGGNGTGTDLYNRTRALPVEAPDSAEKPE